MLTLTQPAQSENAPITMNLCGYCVGGLHVYRVKAADKDGQRYSILVQSECSDFACEEVGLKGYKPYSVTMEPNGGQFCKPR